MSIDIREYRDGDLESCRDLWRELTERHRDIYASPTIGGADPGQHFDTYLRRENLAGPWVVVDGTEVVGMGGLLLNGSEAEVEPVVVRSAYRSRGIGTRLLERLKAEAKARGVKQLSIRPVARNVEAIALFHRAGFSILGHLDMFLELGGGGEGRWQAGIEIHGHRFLY